MGGNLGLVFIFFSVLYGYTDTSFLKSIYHLHRFQRVIFPFCTQNTQRVYV